MKNSPVLLLTLLPDNAELYELSDSKRLVNWACNDVRYSVTSVDNVSSVSNDSTVLSDSVACVIDADTAACAEIAVVAIIIFSY